MKSSVVAFQKLESTGSLGKLYTFEMKHKHNENHLQEKTNMCKPQFNTSRWNSERLSDFFYHQKVQRNQNKTPTTLQRAKGQNAADKKRGKTRLCQVVQPNAGTTRPLSAKPSAYKCLKFLEN